MDVRFTHPCEPCPMCYATALWAHIRKIIYAATKDDATEIGFDDANFHTEMNFSPAGKLLIVEHMIDMRQQAVAIMQKWPEKEDKKHY